MTPASFRGMRVSPHDNSGEIGHELREPAHGRSIDTVR